MAADGPVRDRGEPVRAAPRRRHRPRRGVAVVAAAAADAVRYPGYLAGRRRHQLRDARAGPPDARPRPQPDHRALRGAVRPARRDRRHPRRHRAPARPGRRADRRRCRHGRDRRCHGVGHHRDARRLHRRPSRGRSVGSRRGIAHPAPVASAQRGRPPLRTRGRPGHFGGCHRPLRSPARRDRRGSGRADPDRLAGRSAA